MSGMVISACRKIMKVSMQIHGLLNFGSLAGDVSILTGKSCCQTATRTQHSCKIEAIHFGFKN